MSDRLLTVNAHTTLDYVEAVARGESFEWESIAVANVTTDEEAPDHVRLQFELDNVTEEHLPKHATELELTAEQARRLAAALEERADRVEAASDG